MKISLRMLSPTRGLVTNCNCYLTEMSAQEKKRKTSFNANEPNTLTPFSLFPI